MPLCQLQRAVSSSGSSPLVNKYAFVYFQKINS